MQIVCSEHIYEGLGLYGGGSVSSVVHPLISPAFLFARCIERFEADPIRLLVNLRVVTLPYTAINYRTRQFKMTVFQES